MSKTFLVCLNCSCILLLICFRVFSLVSSYLCKIHFIRKILTCLLFIGDVKRPMYSRTPTPDADLRKSPASPFSSTPSKIPVKQRLSGASHTSVDEDFSDEDDDDDSSPIQRNRVSFSDHQQVRNIVSIHRHI